MANPARKKGSTWEVELLGLLRTWLEDDGIERAPLKGIQDKGDFTGLPDWLSLVEAKSTKTFLLREWVNAIKKKTGSKAWILAYHDDRRKADSVGNVGVVDLAWLLSILWEVKRLKEDL